MNQVDSITTNILLVNSRMLKNIGKIHLQQDNILRPFYQWLKESKKFTPRTVKTKMKKDIVYKNARKLYSKLLSIYFNDYNNTTNEEKKG